MTARNLTAFQTALNLCGLSRQDVAKIYDVSPHTVDAWTRGVRKAPAAVWADLSRTYADFERAAAVFEEAFSEMQEVSLEPDDKAADKQNASAVLTVIVMAALRVGVPVRES